jgi:sugar phosphate isomerase/epimerase
MQLKSGAHLAYCTNIHPAETWDETFAALEQYTLAVRDAVGRERPYGIGLRLSDLGSLQLSEGNNIDLFRRWLDSNNCYVFTINGFPFGRFHGAPVKERVFQPDWASPERLAYTNRLFDILSQILPDAVEGSVSTLPGGFKLAANSSDAWTLIVQNVLSCARHISDVADRRGQKLHLGFEPEPFGLFENTEETLLFFERLSAAASPAHSIADTVGVTYDACHFALQYESAHKSLTAFNRNGIKISKVHLSSALKTVADLGSRERLKPFCDPIYLHQVVARKGDVLTRYADLPIALASSDEAEEWRVHFHVPVYAEPDDGLSNTSDHLLETLDWLAENPAACSHFEIETYTWEALPPTLKSSDVVEQITREYRWTLSELATRGMA